ncbi:MAG TPA: ribonuclease III [Cellvibrionales bacterium]|nr:ribonuclease III [Cellvibrionales bacterium]
MGQIKTNLLTALQKKLDYSFKDHDLLELALTHKSSGSKNNERLEFLGDSLLNTIAAEALFMRYDDVPEGVMTTARSQLVKGKTLAKIGFSLELDSLMILGLGEKGSSSPVKHSIVGDAVEALIGAIYIDSDFKQCQKIVLSLLDVYLEQVSLVPDFKDAKTLLQELMQAERLALPVYELDKVEGPGHEQYFTVKCSVELQSKFAFGEGKSRRAAEQNAAMRVLKQFNYSDKDAISQDDKMTDGRKAL